MPYEFSSQGLEIQESVRQFMNQVIYPNEEAYYREVSELGDDGYPPILDRLKSIALDRGLWNLFLPHLSTDNPGTPLSNLDYAPVSELLGRVGFASEVLNCNAPDTGNMEILHLFGSDRVNAEWLSPLLAGEIRSAFSMTEPDVASSDATNIDLSIVREGGEYVLNGRKWFSSGARAERCKVLIVMGKTNPGGVAPSSAVDDCCAEGHSRSRTWPRSSRLWVLRSWWTSRGDLPQRSRARRQPPW